MSPPKSPDLPPIQWVPGFFPGGKTVGAGPSDGVVLGVCLRPLAC